MIEEKNRLAPLCGMSSEEDLKDVYLSPQGQMAIKSWFKVSKYTKVFAWGYVVMAITMIVFAIASKGVVEDWFWPKISFLIITSAILAFISTILRMMIYSGSPIPILREDLLNTDEDEKIVAANNFYTLLCNILLFPTLAIAVVVLLTSTHLIDFGALMTVPTLTSIMGMLFVAALTLNQVLILRLQFFLNKARNANKALLEGINRRYKEGQTQKNRQS